MLPKSFSFRRPLSSVTHSYSSQTQLTQNPMTTSIRLKSSSGGSRPVVQYGLSVDPHACRKFRTHPFLFIPSIHLVHYNHRVGEHGLRCCQRIRWYFISATVLVRYVVLLKFLQDVLPCFLGIVIDSKIGPRSACHHLHQAFSSTPRPGIRRLWFIVVRPNHWSWIHSPKHGQCFEAEAAMVSKVGTVSPSSQCRWHDSMRHDLEADQTIPESYRKYWPQKHVGLRHGRTQRRPQARPQFATHIACTAEFRTQTTLFVEESFD